jgi:hypothetical protein
MTRGSSVHDDLSGHFEKCPKCCTVNPEEVRIAQPKALRHSVPATTLQAMCSKGREIYQAYLCWLAEPE